MTGGFARFKKMPWLEKWLESVLDVLEWFLKKAYGSEFNSLYTGCNGLCLQAKINPGMSETCAAAISL